MTGELILADYLRTLPLPQEPGIRISLVPPVKKENQNYNGWTFGLLLRRPYCSVENMSVLDLEKFDASVLRGKMNPIDEIDDTVIELVENMKESMYAHNGVGLAAPQVGHGLQITVMDCSEKRDGSELICMINPELEETEGELDGHEGCLSLPGIWGNPGRHRFARASYLSPDGEQETIEREGLWARCIQHEIDHLRGTLFIDHLTGEEKERAEERFNSLSQWENNPLTRLQSGCTWEEYLEEDGKFARFNRDQYNNLFLPSAQLEPFQNLESAVHLVALTELTNFESAFITPALARLCDDVEQLDLTLLPAGEHGDIVDYYATYGVTETPIVVLFDEEYNQIGTWGPRPDDAGDAVGSEDTDQLSPGNKTEQLEQFYKNRGVPAVLDELSELLTGL